MKNLFSKEPFWTPFLIVILGLMAMNTIHSHPETAGAVVQCMTIVAALVGIKRYME